MYQAKIRNLSAILDSWIDLVHRVPIEPVKSGK
jgi:hypothetical protein